MLSYIFNQTIADEVVCITKHHIATAVLFDIYIIHCFLSHFIAHPVLWAWGFFERGRLKLHARIMDFGNIRGFMACDNNLKYRIDLC